jgi:hypothetical protein
MSAADAARSLLHTRSAVTLSINDNQLGFVCGALRRNRRVRTLEIFTQREDPTLAAYVPDDVLATNWRLERVYIVHPKRVTHVADGVLSEGARNERRRAIRRRARRYIALAVCLRRCVSRDVRGLVLDAFWLA